MIVDLDDSDAEETIEPQPPMHVNSALLDRLRSRREPDLPAAPDSSNALVLYRPVVPAELRSFDRGSHGTTVANDLV